MGSPRALVSTLVGAGRETTGAIGLEGSPRAVHGVEAGGGGLRGTTGRPQYELENSRDGALYDLAAQNTFF